jgi:hypothetical protein
LIYDSAEDQYHPDFILTDVNAADFVPLEVWGRDTEDYLQHRAVKEKWYQQEFGDSWWSWDAVRDPRGEEISTFPQRKKHYESKYPLEERETKC